MQHPLKKRTRRRPGVQWLVVTALAALLLAALFAFLALRAQRLRALPAVQDPSQAVRMLESRDSSELESLSVSPSFGAPYELRMREGRLCLWRENALRVLDETCERELREMFTQLVVQDTVTRDAAEVSDHLADMGLSPAVASVLIRYQDGTEALLELGSAIPGTPYFYLRWSGDPGVYMGDPSIAEALAMTAEQLLPVAEIRIAPSLVQELRLMNADGESVFAFSNGASGSLTSPYRYPLDSESVSTLLTALQNLRLGTWQGDVTEENRARLGLDAPLCTMEIRQKGGWINEIDSEGSLVTVEREATELRLTLGRAEGDAFYTCAYEGQAYLVSRFLVETLVSLRRENLITRTPAVLGREALSRVEIHTQAADFSVEVQRRERVLSNNELETDGDGNPLLDTLVLVNGEEASAEWLDAFEGRLSAFTAAGSVPEGYVPEGAPRWTVTLQTQEGTVRTLAGYRMDSFSDALAVDGVIRHYVHDDAVETLLADQPLQHSDPLPSQPR